MNTENLFTALGFSSNERDLYLSLAEVGKTTAQNLAKKVGVPRTTAYSVLHSLVSKGLILAEQKRGTTFFAPSNPDAVLRMVEVAKTELGKREEVAKELVQAIAPYFKNKNYSVPKIRFFEGRASVETLLYDQYLSWQASMAKYDSTWWGYQDHSFVEQYMDWLRWHWERRLPDERIQLLSNKAPIEKRLRGKIERRAIRPIPAKFQFSATIWVNGDYIIMIMTGTKPHYAFELHDAVFALNLRNVFQFLWLLTGER